MKPPIVVDKCYANRKTGTLGNLANRFSLFIPTAFYFEVFTTTSENRTRELRGFPNFRRVHTASLLQAELRSGRPAAISMEAPNLSFDEAILSSDWQLTPEQRALVDAHKSTYVEPMVSFWREIISIKEVPTFSAVEIGATRGSGDDFVALCNILRDVERIQRFAAEIGFSHASKINSDWFYFRLFQALLLQGFVLLRRHPNRGDFVSDKNLEHDVQDSEYLTLGLHANALATTETSSKLGKAAMGWRFKLLEPHAHLES